MTGNLLYQRIYSLDGHLFLKFGFLDPLFTYKMVNNTKFDVVDHFMDKKRVDHTKFKINLIVQVVCTYIDSS